MDRREWQDKKNECLTLYTRQDITRKKLISEEGIENPIEKSVFTIGVMTPYQFVQEFDIQGDATNWRINNVDEYLLINGEKVYEADCEEVI